MSIKKILLTLLEIVALGVVIYFALKLLGVW